VGRLWRPVYGIIDIRSRISDLLDPIYCVGGVGGVGVSRDLFEHILDVLPYVQAFADFRVGVKGITLLFLVIPKSH
jgi:hypothetical protein